VSSASRSDNGRDETRRERVVKNEAAFREHNERRAALEMEVLPDHEHLLLVCECGDATCYRGVEIGSREYADARARDDQFVVIPGHVFPEYEHVVHEAGSYMVVRKR
jgi:hypothetical protein